MGPISQTISIHIPNVMEMSFCFSPFPGHEQKFVAIDELACEPK